MIQIRKRESPDATGDFLYVAAFCEKAIIKKVILAANEVGQCIVVSNGIPKEQCLLEIAEKAWNLCTGIVILMDEAHNHSVAVQHHLNRLALPGKELTLFTCGKINVSLGQSLLLEEQIPFGEEEIKHFFRNKKKKNNIWKQKTEPGIFTVFHGNEKSLSAFFLQENNALCISDHLPDCVGTEETGNGILVPQTILGETLHYGNILFFRSCLTGNAKMVSGEGLYLGRRYAWEDGSMLQDTVSRDHGMVIREGKDMVYIAPVKETTNGTVVNGCKVHSGEKRTLHHGDTLELGTNATFICEVVPVCVFLLWKAG